MSNDKKEPPKPIAPASLESTGGLGMSASMPSPGAIAMMVRTLARSAISASVPETPA